jgi:outer membrane protein assembly factor BamB
VHKVSFVLAPSPDPTPSAPPDDQAPAAPPPIWSVDVGSPVWSGLVLHGEALLVGTDGGALIAMDSASGSERWRFLADGSLRATPTVAADTVVIPSDDGSLARLDLANGTRLWRRALDAEPPVARIPSGAPGDRYDHFASSALVDGERLFVGCGAGHLHALELATGHEIWRFVAADAIRSTPAISGGRVVFGSFDGRVYALDVEDGAEIWRHDTGAPVVSSPAIVGGNAVVGSRSYDLVALDVRSGEPRWTFYRWFSWIESSVVASGDALYVGSSDAQMLHALNALDGKLRWAYDTGGSAWGTPAVTDQLVFIGSVGVGVAEYIAEQRGGFHAVERATGRVRWSLPVAGDSREGGSARLSGFVATPAVGGGRVYVGGLDRVVRALPID